MQAFIIIKNSFQANWIRIKVESQSLLNEYRLNFNEMFKNEKVQQYKNEELLKMKLQEPIF